MEMPPEKEHIAPRQQEFTAVFSAKTKWSLLSYLENMQLFLEKEASLDIEPVVQALHRRNHNLEHRAAFTVTSTQELIEKLKIFRTSRESSLQQGIYTSFDLQPCPESASKDREINAAEQWAQGASIAFKEADIGNRSGWIHLPHYAFDHNTSFHFDVSSINEKSSDVEDNINQPVIQDQFTYDEPYVQGHVFNNERVLVGATYGSLAIEAFFNLFPEENSGSISKLSYISPIVIKQGETIEIQAKPLQKDQVIELQIMYREPSSGLWKPAAIGQCGIGSFDPKKSISRTLSIH